MRWQAVDSDSSNEVYHLYKDDKIILTLTLNPFSNSARVECAQQKRVFLIRKEGFMRNKVVLRNEYGVKIGELGHESKSHFIDLNNDRFYYTIQENKGTELVLYKDTVNQPILTCGLGNREGEPSVKFTNNKNLSATTYPGLLMSLCWYMFLPVTKETTAEMAS